MHHQKDRLQGPACLVGLAELRIAAPELDRSLAVDRTDWVVVDRTGQAAVAVVHIHPGFAVHNLLVDRNQTSGGPDHTRTDFVDALVVQILVVLVVDPDHPEHTDSMVVDLRYIPQAWC